MNEMMMALRKKRLGAMASPAVAEHMDSADSQDEQAEMSSYKEMMNAVNDKLDRILELLGEEKNLEQGDQEPSGGE